MGCSHSSANDAHTRPYPFPGLRSRQVWPGAMTDALAAGVPLLDDDRLKGVVAFAENEGKSWTFPEACVSIPLQPTSPRRTLHESPLALGAVSRTAHLLGHVLVQCGSQARSW